VATRLPPEYRLTPEDANELLREEVFGRLTVHDLPAEQRLDLFATASRDRIAGGRIYDAHIAEVARSAGARVIVTDNRRHFLAALRHGIKVETPAEFLVALKVKRHAQ
jgi:predicted nucleic acid-binding protein